MQEVLELRGKVGALDRFYALGGDSIKVIRLISILHSKGIQLKVSDFKELQTVRKIAEAAALRTVSNEISSCNLPYTFFQMSAPNLVKTFIKPPS